MPVTSADISATFIYTSRHDRGAAEGLHHQPRQTTPLDAPSMINETSVIADEDVTYLYLPPLRPLLRPLLIQLGSFDLGRHDPPTGRGDPNKIVPKPSAN